MCAVTAAPGAASARVWEVMSRGREPRVGRAVPEGVDVAANVAYGLGTKSSISGLQLTCAAGC